MTKHIINPTKFNNNKTNTPQLKAIFSEMIKNAHEHFLDKGDYGIEINEQTVYFRLTHDILIRPRKNNREGKRIEILESDIFAEGGNSDIHKSLGVLIPEKEFQFIKKSYYKTRLCKYIPTKSTRPSEITKEAEHTMLNKKLHCKEAILDDYYGYIVMRRARKADIHILVKKIEDGEVNITVEQRLVIIYKILKAFQKQVHDVDLIHGDIKSENIIVDWKKLAAYIIDYGYARKASTEKGYGFPYGTYGFFAPEILEGELQSQQSDLYALAMAIAEFLGDTSIDDSALDFSSKNQSVRLQNNRNYLAQRTWNKLFTGIELEDELKSDILSVLKNLSHNDPAMRNLKQAKKDWRVLQNNYLTRQNKPTIPHPFFNTPTSSNEVKTTEVKDATPTFSSMETTSGNVTNSLGYQAL